MDTVSLLLVVHFFWEVDILDSKGETFESCLLVVLVGFPFIIGN